MRGWALGVADMSVWFVLETAHKLVGVNVEVFGAKSCGAGGAWYDGAGLCCFPKKLEIRLGFDAFDVSSAALTFLRCFLLVRWISKFLDPLVPTLTLI
jgi:hypothetical protein